MVQSFQASWNTLLNPIGLQVACANYLQRSIHAHIVKLSFVAETDGPLLDNMRPTGILRVELDVSTTSQGGRKPE